MIKVPVFLLLACLCAGAVAADSGDIEGVGCVTAGVEASCLIVNDLKAKKDYNILVQGKKPKPGDAISFQGKAHEGPTLCVQGTPVDVSSWKQLKMHCPAAKAAMVAKHGAMIVKDGVKAWVNRMPGSTPKLIVTVEVQVPTTGWDLSLVRAEPQGINPSIILLKLMATPPSGEAGQMVTKSTVRYEESPPKAQYSQATVVYGDDSVTVDVGSAS